jgi:hypothetical protein
MKFCINGRKNALLKRQGGGGSLDREDEDAEDHKLLSDILIRDLTAYRTLGLPPAMS